MTKVVVLKLRGLKYSGDSIGSDLRIEIEALNHFVGINKKLSLGKSAEFNKEIGLFFTTHSYFSLPVHLHIIERDPVFNDVGSLQVTIRVDLNSCQPQHSTHKIEVMESRAIFGKAVAIFHLILEAQVLQMTRYVAELPDFPHPGGLNYPEATRAKTWFRVGHEGARYIHTGRISRGCITITENQRWDELYQKLINARKGDGISIGTLLVVE